MTKRFFTHTLVAILLAIAATAASSEGLDYNFLQATPIGSWQLREDVNIDHKGRQTVAETRSSLVGEEMRDGEKHYWIEMTMNSFKVKKGKRKPSGDTVIFKSLVPESVFQDDPANAVNNLRAFGKEMIIQTGDQDPIRMTGAGGMAESMMQAMGTKISYTYNFVGDEDVTVKAGSFPTRKIQGTGSTEMKVIFKKISVTSSNTAWISDRVPFGMVKAEGESTTNGKKSTHSSELIEYGDSGAVSQITKTPEELPAMPNMKDLFGQ
ncbi:MAG: hypothetical protein ACR2P1_29915 [Pseudomonadales bacterium]